MEIETKTLDLLLDETQCPVARMRLFSQGINLNNRLFKPEQVLCDRGCLACGNCVDACPVVRETKGFVFIQNQRTSMALEHMVAEECRRCYKCIMACPQVEKGIKEYAGAFRRGEKIVHLLTASIVILLAATGILLAHYTDFLPVAEIDLLRWTHRILGIFLLCMPVLYYVLDKNHMIRMLKKTFSWYPAERDWIKGLLLHIRSEKKYPMPPRVQFNPAQKGWYLYTICILFPVLGITGIIQWLGLDYSVVGASFLSFIILIHMIFALITDLLLLVHIYIKYLRNWAIVCFDIFKVYIVKRHLIYPLLYDSPLQVRKYSKEKR